MWRSKTGNYRNRKEKKTTTKNQTRNARKFAQLHRLTDGTHEVTTGEGNRLKCEIHQAITEEGK